MKTTTLIGKMMTETKQAPASHTPGPWRVNEDYASVLSNQELGLIAQCAPQASKLNSEGGGPVTKEQLSNARLIAAAPELLEALQRVLAIHSPNVKWTRQEAARSIATWVKDTRAIIAKAEGK